MTSEQNNADREPQMVGEFIPEALGVAPEEIGRILVRGDELAVDSKLEEQKAAYQAVREGRPRSDQAQQAANDGLLEAVHKLPSSPRP